ncbi:hypothetical protein RFI_21249 [Reticulomyxa filosa]|uniref:Uncharacterized protein n=1 Tax=Reticulomyxa filosa TaxID=46433 RepID=X6MQ26_RETFI|nr:hypothetical protein RFI_21249 [Reticulomyxa filosa]|eukprot:ETO16108.1 hypothetical protein RFI_21249 [Reticulomyxa filosa]
MEKKKRWQLEKNKKDGNVKKKDNNGKIKNKNRKKEKEKRGEIEKEKWENIPQNFDRSGELGWKKLHLFDWPRLCWQINKVVIGNIRINDIYPFDNAKMFFITKATRSDGLVFLAKIKENEYVMILRKVNRYVRVAKFDRGIIQNEAKITGKKYRRIYIAHLNGTAGRVWHIKVVAPELLERFVCHQRMRRQVSAGEYHSTKNSRGSSNGIRIKEGVELRFTAVKYNKSYEITNKKKGYKYQLFLYDILIIWDLKSFMLYAMNTANKSDNLHVCSYIPTIQDLFLLK